MADEKARTLSQVVADLLTLDPADFDPLNLPCYYTKLEPLVLEVIKLADTDTEAAKILLGAAEKMDGWDLGPPGPLVHFVEHLSGYEVQLTASVKRKPTPHTLWMVNRIINSVCDTAKGPWLELLGESIMHRYATEEAKKEAEGFLKHHDGKR